MSPALFKSASLVLALDMNPIASLSISKRMFASIGLMFIFAWLIAAPCHANLVVTVGQGPGYDYADFQDAIDYVLSVTNEEEATIKLAGGDYVRVQGFSINIGLSEIHRLSVMPISPNDNVRLLQHPGCMNNDSTISIVGSQFEDKEVAIENISFIEGTYMSAKGVSINRGLKRVQIKGCLFSNIARGISLSSDMTYGMIHELDIENNVFDYTSFPFSSLPYASINLTYMQRQTNPLNFAYRIIGNQFVGKVIQHVKFSFKTHVPALTIEDNLFHSEPTGEGPTQSYISLPGGNYVDEDDYIAPVIRHNSFIDSGIHIDSISAVLTDNKFWWTYASNSQSIKLDNGQTYPITVNRNRMADIRRNVFVNNTDAAIRLIPYHGLQSSPVYRANVANNSFIDCAHMLKIINEPYILDGPEFVPLFASNLALNHANPIVVYDNASSGGQQLQLLNPVLARNCHFENDPGGEQYQNVELEVCTIGDPQINMGVNGEYSIIWNETVKSPLINAGCPELDGVIQTDPDGTPPDIGAIYYPHHNRKYFQMSNTSNIHWLSFPVVDDRSNSDGIYWNELGKMFSEHMENTPNSNLNTIAWSYEELQTSMQYDFQNAEWSNKEHKVNQPMGYKVHFNPGVTDCLVVVDGFKADPDTTPVSWAVMNNQNQPFENWIGYFVTKTNRAGDALSRFLPGSTSARFLDYVHTIKTQTWVTSRVSEEAGSRWIVDPNSYTLSEGQMVALLLLPNAPKEMYWNTDYPPVAPIVRPRATAFEYEEKLDYTPVFLDFDPEDMPAEVGLYVNGVCKGAAVVDTTTVDVALYLDDAKDGGELQVMFYYEGKGKKAAKGWKVYNPESLVFEDTGLRAEQIGKYAYLSFTSKEGDSPVPLVTSLKPNYPNPFNPETHISFILAQDMQAKLDIFNVRGQKVLTLCNAELSKGKHTLLWNGKDEHGRMVASGIYFSRLATPEGSFTGKMMLMK